MGKWKKCTISDLGTVVGGATPSTKNPGNYDGGLIPWITPKDLAGFSGRFISHGERNITEQGLKSCSTQLMPAHTILFSSRAPIGYVAIARNEVCTNQGFKSVIPNNDTDYMFLYYLLKFNKNKIESLGSGTTFKEVSGSTMRGIEVDVPESIEEQRRIALILASLDDKIENNEKLNQNLAEQAEALFKERFLSYEDLPLGWKKMTLGDISDMGAGGDKPKIISDQKTETYQYPIYSNGISDEGLYGFTSDYKISSESVTVSARGTIGFVCLRHIPYTPIVRLVTLVPHTDVVSAKYLYLWLKSIPIHGTGTTQQQLTVPDFRKTEIVIPSEAEMREFTETVDPLFQQIWANQKENSSLADIRDTLLPRLMSGEIDVSKLVD